MYIILSVNSSLLEFAHHFPPYHIEAAQTPVCVVSDFKEIIFKIFLEKSLTKGGRCRIVKLLKRRKPMHNCFCLSLNKVMCMCNVK